MKKYIFLVGICLSAALSVSALSIGSSHTDYVAISQQYHCANNVHGLDYASCSLGKISGFMDFHNYLSCLGVVEKTTNCDTAECTNYAPRQELVGIATRIRNVSMKESYVCQNIFSDVSATTTPGWTCQVAERAANSGLISRERVAFGPLLPASRVEAYSILLASICIDPSSESITGFAGKNQIEAWQKKVIKSAIRNGLTSRTESDFNPSRAIKMEELYALASRVIQHAETHPTCPPIIPEVMCEQ